LAISAQAFAEAPRPMASAAVAPRAQQRASAP
jgi:hypothetical protein